MDIYRIAIEKEKKMEHFYNQMFKETKHKGLKNIFSIMAKQENNHANIFNKLINSFGTKNIVETFDVHPLDMPEIKNILLEIKKERKTHYTANPELVIYQKIKNLEKESENFYHSMAVGATDIKLKQLLLLFASEERNHYFLMCEIYEMMRAPITWIENAEFNHIGKFY